MRGENRKPIVSCLKLPQFTIMNVIEGQAGLVIYSSLIFYCLTIDNILNIIILIILAGVSISLVLGDNGIVSKAKDAKQNMQVAANEEQKVLANLQVAIEEQLNGGSSETKLTFTINGKSYQFEEGMTWERWVNSDYNKVGYIVYGDGVALRDPYMSFESVYRGDNPVLISNYIIANGQYDLIPGGAGN